MNIETQSCGLLMLLILFVILTREKSLDLARSRKFRDTMLSCIVCIAMDIMSIIGIVLASDGHIPHWAAMLVCKLYLVLLTNVGYRWLIYVADEFLNESTHKWLRDVYRIIFYVGVAVILILPIDYHYEGRTVYSYGPSVMTTYAIAFVMLASTITLTLIGGKGTSRRRKRVILIWQICWILAAILQLSKPDLLVVGFGAAFGMVLIYAELENPNEVIDRVTGQFSSNALYTYLIELYKREKTFSAMHLDIDYGPGDFDLELEMKAMRRIANFLDKGRQSYVFRESDHDFIVIYNDKESMEADYERVRSELVSYVEMPIEIAYTLIPDSTILKNPDEFMQFQRYSVRNADASECVVAGKEQADEMRKYFDIRDKINWALANDGIEVYYQPIYSVEEKKITSAEALTRIRDSEGRLIMPSGFIPVAEENGLIIPLGMEVFRHVCRFLATGVPQDLGIEFIEVNLSMAQFDEKNPAGFVQDIISEYGIRPGWINLEITETADPATRQIVLKNMRKLIEKGVQFSLDDFGTGRSNIDYFISMPLDMIKFDKKFTNWYFEDEQAREVMKSIVSIIEKMKLPIVMEGVETREQLDTMIELGASYIQGYYFSKPLPEGEFIRYLKAEADRERI